MAFHQNDENTNRKNNANAEYDGETKDNEVRDAPYVDRGAFPPENIAQQFAPPDRSACILNENFIAGNHRESKADELDDEMPALEEISPHELVVLQSYQTVQTTDFGFENIGRYIEQRRRAAENLQHDRSASTLTVRNLIARNVRNFLARNIAQTFSQNLFYTRHTESLHFMSLFQRELMEQGFSSHEVLEFPPHTESRMFRSQVPSVAALMLNSQVPSAAESA